MRCTLGLNFFFLFFFHRYLVVHSLGVHFILGVELFSPSELLFVLPYWEQFICNIYIFGLSLLKPDFLRLNHLISVASLGSSKNLGFYIFLGVRQSQFSVSCHIHWSRGRCCYLEREAGWGCSVVIGKEERLLELVVVRSCAVQANLFLSFEGISLRS